MKDGFMFIIIENSMDSFSLNERYDYTGSRGIERLGPNPDDFEYELDVLPFET